MKRSGPDIAGIEFGGVVHMEHVFREVFQGGKVVGADEAFRVEIVFHPGISPVNGDHFCHQ